MNMMYLVKLQGTNDYSMFGFIMWTEQIEHAKRYTYIEAMQLIKTIPEHIGVGKLIEAS